MMLLFGLFMGCPLNTEFDSSQPIIDTGGSGLTGATGLPDTGVDGDTASDTGSDSDSPIDTAGASSTADTSVN